MAGMDGKITDLSAAELARAIASGALSSSEVVDAHLTRIEAVNPHLNAVVVPLFDQARAQARAADEARARKEPLGPLHGIPITIKESFDVAGTPTTLGLSDKTTHCAKQDCPLVQRLRHAGAIVVGKTNVPQLLSYNETDNPVYGRTNNPWNLDRAPGGSSGGEAAIIAAGGSPLGLGSDIGGSNRLPAHACGIHGLKPTSTRLTMIGHGALFRGQEAVLIAGGPLARHVGDLMLAMKILAAPGQEAIDPTVPPVPLYDPAAVRLNGLRMAMYVDNGFFSVSPAIRRAVQEAAAALRDRGVTVEDWTPPEVRDTKPIYMGLLYGDGARGMRRELGTSQRDWRVAQGLKRASMPSSVLRAAARYFALTGQHRTADSARCLGMLSTDSYWRLSEQRARYRQRFMGALDAGRFDAILSPPDALPAYTHGSSLQLQLDPMLYATLYNLLGLPAGVVAATRVRAGEESDRSVSRDKVERMARMVEIGSTGLPVGVQVAARPWREDIVLATMAALEAHFRSQPDYPARAPVGAT